jgi:amino acid adenylation domain-containing protein
MDIFNHPTNPVPENTPEDDFLLWSKKLEGVEPLQLPHDFPRSPSNESSRRVFNFSIHPDLVSKLENVENTPKGFLFVKLLAAFQILLFRWTGQYDLCLGIWVSESDVGKDSKAFKPNKILLPLRSNFQSNLSFESLTAHTQKLVQEVYDLPQHYFEKTLALIQDKSPLIDDIFQAIFGFSTHPNTEKDKSNLAESIHPNKLAKCDLSFELSAHVDGINGVVNYNSSLFKEQTISDFTSHFLHLLASICENDNSTIGTLNILPAEEENRLLNTFNPKEKALPQNITILNFFKDQVKTSPGQIAVQFGNHQLTYRDLDLKSNQLANFILSKGIKPESLIPICLDRSLEMIIGILGILKAGGAYVPIDPTYPDERIEYVFSDTLAKFVITTSDLKTRLQNIGELIILDEDWTEIEKMSEELIFSDIRQNHLAYIIYTSGSTGKPKGVMIEHKGFAASTLARKSYYGNLGAVLLIPSFAFDSSVAVIFGALTTGGKLILCKSELIKDPYHIKELLQETEAILCVPSYYRFLLEEDLLAHSNLSNVIVAGENLDGSLVKLHFEKSGSASLFNEYGPTECTVWASVAEIKSPDVKVTIGNPINYSKIHILNKDNQLNPINVTGELCIAGETVSRGYLNLEKLTSEKFVKNPFNPNPDAKMYRTGDLARWLPDGNIEYLGRIDDQVKIRGYRIELGEIESTINSMSGIKESAVILREDVPGQKQLVGYVVSQEPLDALSPEDWINEIRKGLQQKLPNYMVPSKIVLLDHLPLTANNKIDKKNLPKPLENGAPNTSPTTNLEKTISEVWCNTLKREQIDINADFFEMGGNSLLAVKVISLLEKEIGSNLGINLIFKHPTISDLAKAIENSNHSQMGLNSLLAVKTSGRKPPLYMVHGIGSSASIYYRLAKFVDNEQPIYGFQPKGLDGVESPDKSLEEMAAYYISDLIDQNPEGPYHLSGYCFGGCVAYEMAKQLQSMGKKVEKLILFDTAVLHYREKLSRVEKIQLPFNNFLTQVNFALNEPRSYIGKKTRSIERKMNSLLLKMKRKPNPKSVKGSTNSLEAITNNNFRILNKYSLVPYNGTIHLFKAKTRLFYVAEPNYYGWIPFVEKVHIINIGGHHENIFQDPKILKDMAEKIQKILDEKSD